ncbi:MAG: hypothetical protein K6B75_02890, partial [Lachnospiraceae bacterium]|nr:hypothetical protein [Lachnospiraceae bacterium]
MNRRRQNNNIGAKLAVGALIVILLILALIFRGVNPFGEERKEKEIEWNPDTVLKIGDSEMDKNEAYVYLLAKRAEYEQYFGGEIWNYEVDSDKGTIGDKIKEDVLNKIIYVKVV